MFGDTPLSKVLRHIARADPSTDHSRTLQASVSPLPTDWNHQCHTWIQTTESDLAPINTGLAIDYHRAQNRQAWSTLVGMATSIAGQAT